MISISKVDTYPRFETEARGNSEMAYLLSHKRVGVTLQATVETLYEKLNTEVCERQISLFLLFFLLNVNKEDVPSMYSCVCWCEFIDLVVFFGSYCVTPVTHFIIDAFLTSRQKLEKLKCLYKNLLSNNFRRMAVLNMNYEL